MPYLRFLVALLALAACDNSSTSSKTTANNPAPVYHKGALKIYPTSTHWARWKT